MKSEAIVHNSLLHPQFNRAALTLTQHQNPDFLHSLSERHAHLFAHAPVFISPDHLAHMAATIAAIQAVVAQPNWWNETHYAHCSGVFMGYDFHLNDDGAHLIEINTNAGGAFLNNLLLQSQRSPSLASEPAANVAVFGQTFVAMFRKEWQLEREDAPLRTLAIVDEHPAEQYLYPEFVLAQQLFAQAGIRTLIADPTELSAGAEGLYLGEEKIDLIYNRLTDFSLTDYPHILNAFHTRQVVLTPHPEAYARYADKRNLAKLTDTDFLKSIGTPDETIAILQRGIPQAKLVHATEGAQWWAERKHWFFKPVNGYGAKGAYRGDKITKRVFEEILAGDYIAQKLAPPGECVVEENGIETRLKFDLRCYVYDGQIQLMAARLYQGQTTNFRTPGGGFALVHVTQ